MEHLIAKYLLEVLVNITEVIQMSDSISSAKPTCDNRLSLCELVDRPSVTLAKHVHDALAGLVADLQVCAVDHQLLSKVHAR
jgi:hypothetical protein